MPDPISSANQSLNYTPAGPDEAEGGMCVAPNDAPEPIFTTTYGDGEIHREGFGFRVDPSATTTGKITVSEHDVDVTMTGVDALVAATDRNADGSKGARLAASANIWQGTATIPNGSGGEFTAGVGIGVGVDVSSGTRDADSDGNSEYCLRTSFGFVVLGGCSETIPALVDEASEALSR
jgi:hypothetical protein